MQHKACPVIVEKIAGCNDVGRDAAQSKANPRLQEHAAAFSYIAGGGTGASSGKEVSMPSPRSLLPAANSVRLA